MKIATTIIPIALAFLCTSATNADTFGSGANTFNIDFVTIGNPGNVDDMAGNPNPAGKVDYAYRIGQFEISEDMVDKANALGDLSLTHDNRGANKPATSMTWFEAATFVNWLNMDSGSSPAYKFDTNGIFQLWQPGDTGYDSANPYRNTQANFFLPSMDEWYKAAYFAPMGGVYYNYPTGSDSPPDGIDIIADGSFDAVFKDDIDASIPGPKDINDVGVWSPYGTAGQGGNVWEWEETDYDLMNGSGDSNRGLRGGSWLSNFANLGSSDRGNITPNRVSETIGFRVASVVPEPSTALLAGLSLLSLTFLTKRLRT